MGTTGDGERTLSQKDVAGLELSVPLYRAAEFGPGGPVACAFRGIAPLQNPIWVNLPDEIRVTISGFGGTTPPVRGAERRVHRAPERRNDRSDLAAGL